MGNLSTIQWPGEDGLMGPKPLPVGIYKAHVYDTEVRKSKSGNDYLLVSLTVDDDQHQGRQLYDYLMVWHPNETVREIATKRLAQLCEAAGLDKPEDSSMLHGQSVLVSVTVESDPEFGPRNKVRGYKPMPGTQQQEEVPQMGAKRIKPDQNEDIPF